MSKHTPQIFPGFIGWVVEFHTDFKTSWWTATNRDDPRVTLESETIEGIQFLIECREGAKNADIIR